MSENRLHFLDYWRIIRVRKLVILAVFLLVVTTTTVVTLWLPKTYASKAQIDVSKDKTDVTSFEDPTPHAVFDYNFIQTQFERLQSKIVLYNVIEELGLNERWARRYGRPAPYSVDDAFELLHDRMDLRQIRNTSVIEIRVFSEEPAEAAEIANKIAEEYKEHRYDLLVRKTQGGLKSVRQQVTDKEKEVAELAAKVAQLQKELNISDAQAVSESYVFALEPEILRRALMEQRTAEIEYVTADNKLRQLEGLSAEELRYTLNTVHPDQNLTILLNQYSTAEQALVGKREIYGEENELVKQAVAELKKVEEQLDKAINGIIDGLRKTRQAAKDTHDGLTQKLEEAKRQDIEMAGKSRPYYEAKQELKVQRENLNILQRKLALMEADAELPTTPVEITGPAVPSAKPVRPNIPLNIAAAIVVGLMAGIGLAFFIEYLDTSVKTIDDIEQVLQSPVLSVIPQGVTSLLEEGPESPNAEAYRVLRTNILFSRKHDGMNAITAVSGGAAEGKSTTLLNLAVVFAQNGNRVLLVDTDLRRPSLHKSLGLSNSVGLTSYLMKQRSLEEVIQTTCLPGLDFLPSGKLPSSSLGILNSPRFHEFVQEIKRRYDFVLFDSPPVLGVSDASILIREMDITLLVLQHRKYPQAMNVRAKQTIDKFGGNLLGVVLNNINLSTDSYYYYYSGFGYGYTNQNQTASDDKPNGTHQKAVAEADKVALKRKY